MSERINKKIVQESFERHSHRSSEALRVCSETNRLSAGPLIEFFGFCELLTTSPVFGIPMQPAVALQVRLLATRGVCKALQAAQH